MADKEFGRIEKYIWKFLKGKEFLKPLNTGRIDSHVSCLREYGANVFFYTKNNTTIMLDAGCSYERLQEKMKWINLAPEQISHIFLTHLDLDRMGALLKGNAPVFENAKIYVGSLENQYVAGLVRRKVLGGLYKLPQTELQRQPAILKDGAVVEIDGIRVEALLVPGHTWGHMVYLVDDSYLFTGDSLWLGPDGGYSYINALAEDNKLAVESLQHLKMTLTERELRPVVVTAHTGFTRDFSFAFAHVDQVCDARKKQKIHDPDAPVDPYDETGDIMNRAKSGFLPEQKRING